MIKNKNYKKLASEWFQKAEEDLKSAQILLEENGPTGSVCFHCHQAIEKYLKGFLILEGLRLEKTHDLIKLLKEAGKFEPRFLGYLESAKTLNTYYIATRYPVPPPIEYPREKAKEALEVVKEISAFISR